MPQTVYLVPAIMMTVALIFVLPQAWQKDNSPFWRKCLALAVCLLWDARFFLEAFDRRGQESLASSVVGWLSLVSVLALAVVVMYLPRATAQKP